jgi:hypothetical protein
MQFRHNPSPWNASTKYRLVEGQSNELPALAAERVRHQVAVITASGVGCHRTCRKASWRHCLPTVIHSRFRGDEIQPHIHPINPQPPLITEV